MPVMPRPKGKTTKIAFKVLGIPLNYDKRRKRRLSQQRRHFGESVRYAK